MNKLASQLLYGDKGPQGIQSLLESIKQAQQQKTGKDFIEAGPAIQELFHKMGIHPFGKDFLQERYTVDDLLIGLMELNKQFEILREYVAVNEIEKAILEE